MNSYAQVIHAQLMDDFISSLTYGLLPDMQTAMLAVISIYFILLSILIIKRIINIIGHNADAEHYKDDEMSEIIKKKESFLSDKDNNI